MLSCPSNESYGHAEALRAYTGEEGPVVGRLQHGWSPLGGVPVGDYLDKRGIRFLVWSSKFAHDGFLFNSIEPLPPERTFIIGAPILYIEKPKSERRSSVLAVPAHSILDRAIPGATWKDYCKFVRAYEPTAHILVHANDVRLGHDRIVADHGLTPVTAGHIRSLDFLHRIAAIVNSYDCIISNCVQTICFYALYLKKHVQICGPVTKTTPADAADEAFDADWICKYYPTLLSGTSDSTIAEPELGNKLTPEEVKRIAFLHASL